MSNQPEALQLAAAMSLAFPGNLGIDKAAAELRRLSAVEAQRDALLEVLRALVRNEGLDAYFYLDKGIGTTTAAGQRWLNARAALAGAEGGGNLPPPLQVPNDVAAILTTTDIAWLETRRLTKLWQELGQMRWAGADEGWDRAIEAVRSRLNNECQAVMYWKLTADKSQATAVELLRKMQGVKYD